MSKVLKGRIAYTLLFLFMMAVSATAQDFKLFYAKNVTDVTNFRNLSERKVLLKPTNTGETCGMMKALASPK